MIDARAGKAVEYLDALIEQQTAVLTNGGGPGGVITRVEEYRAGVMLIRSMTRLRGEIVTIFSKEEDESDDEQTSQK